MNALLKSLDYKDLLFFDLEMASQYKDVRENPAMFKTFQYKNRDRKEDTLPTEEETVALYNRTAALSPLYGRIVSGTFGLVAPNKETGKMEIRVVSFQGEEKEIIKGIIHTYENSKNRKIIGFNSSGYDLPYLRKRHNILAMGNYPELLNDVGKKSWDMDKVTYDLMQLFKGSSFISDGLDELCMAYGVPSPKETGVKGSEVSAAFWDGRIADIVRYCEADIVSTINLFRKMRGEEIITDVIISQ